MVVDVDAALVDLGRVADRIAELGEWDRLADEERRSPFPSALLPADDLREDIRALYGWFLDLDTKIREVLKRSELIVPSMDLWEGWWQRLRKLEEQVRECRVHERFINP